MTMDSCGDLCGNPCAKKPLIIQGGAKSLAITLMDKTTALPMDLTGATEIKVTFAATNPNGFLNKTLTSSGGVTILSAVGGKILVSLASADTLLFVIGVTGIQIEVTIASVVTIVNIDNAIETIAQLYPGA